MSKKIYILTLVLISSTIAFGQSINIGEKWFAGGDLVLNSNRNLDAFGGAAQVGYKVTNNFSTGVRATYLYTRDKVFDGNVHSYGGGPFVRYDLLLPFFVELPLILYGEYEYLRFDATDGVTEAKFSDNFNSVLLGGGISQRAGRNVSIDFLVLYNVIYDDTSNLRPYNSPWVIRGGVNFGF